MTEDDAEAIRTFALTWSDAWKYAPLWRASLQERQLTAREAGEAYLQHIATPIAPLEAFYRLVDEGAFAAADTLVGYGPFIDAVGQDVLDRSQAVDSLQRRRTSAQLHILGYWESLLNRARRVNLRVDEFDRRALQAYCSASRDRASALGLLSEIREQVESAEKARVAWLREQYQMRWRNLGDSPQNTEWRRAVELSLDRADLPLAESLVQYGPDAAVASTLPPRLPQMPKFAPPEELMRWSLHGTQAPRSYYERWDVLRGGTGPRRLVELHLRICEDEHTSAPVVAAFVEELENVIGGPGEEKTVRAVNGGFETTLCGLGDAACPAIDPVGIPFFVVPKNEPALPERAEETPLAVFFAADPNMTPRRGDMFLTPYDLHQCLIDRKHIAFNLLRVLCKRIPPERLLPSTTMARGWVQDWIAQHATAVHEMAESGPVWVSGASGTGKRLVLDAVMESFARAGWKTRHITRAADVRTLESALEEHAAVRTAVAVDEDVWADAGVHLEPFRDCGGLVIASCTPMGAPAGFRHYRMPLAPFALLHAFAERVLDVSGYLSLDSSIVDRIAFYAAGRPALLHVFLRALFHHLSDTGLPRAAGIPPDALDRAYRRRDFQPAARAVLLHPLDRMPRTNLTLASAFVAVDLAADELQNKVGVEDISAWLSAESIDIPDDVIVQELQVLEELELVSVDRNSREISLTRQGGGYAAMSLAGPAETYFARAKERFVSTLPRLNTASKHRT